jgi:hypothetical protein
MEFVYTNYLTADILRFNGLDVGLAQNNAELTGHDSTGRVGVQYSS